MSRRPSRRTRGSKGSKGSNGSKGSRGSNRSGPAFFSTSAAFRAWLDRHHGTRPELLLGFYKTSSGRGGITYQQALDQALCYGWIDGVRKNFDAQRYTVRFSPRKRTSHWSRINIRRAAELKAEGLMRPGGIDAYERRDEGKTINYSYELRAASFSPAFERRFKAHQRAWAFFMSQAPWYQRVARFWVTTAKKEETRERRLERLITDSAAGRRLARTTPGRKRR